MDHCLVGFASGDVDLDDGDVDLDDGNGEYDDDVMMIMSNVKC